MSRLLPILHRTARQHSAIRTEEFLYSQLIPYIGNKRKLLPLIQRAIETTGVTQGAFLDAFAGSGVVSRLAKLLGFRVLSNDWEPYACEIGRCFIGCNHPPEFARWGGAEKVFALLNALPPCDGYITRHLCPRDDDNFDVQRERMFFTRRNGMKIDAMREQIARWEYSGCLSDEERAYLLAPFVFALSYVSNTSGVFKGFHNGWGGATGTALYRIRSDIELKRPVLFDNGLHNEIYRLDAEQLAERLRADRAEIDIAYLDPPYNQHPYGSNYHVLNTLVLWDKPPLSRHITRGDKSAIRKDWRTQRRSAYNYAEASAAYERLLQALDARFILTSYSTDGNIPLRTMLQSAARRGALSCVHNAYKRYRVSSQRMSNKPMNIEFILIVDTSQPGTENMAEQVYDELMNAEKAALARSAGDGCLDCAPA
jgi:adenine-specific DNA-methyltransferase